MAHAFDPVHHAIDGHSLEFPGLAPIEIPFGISKFMLMEVVAALLIVAIFVPLARHVASGPVTKGRFFNLLEMMVVFVRDGIVKQAIHGHNVAKFLPLFLTLFFFILGCNLLGLVPGGATPTANINVTAVLAGVVVGTVLFEGIRKSGLIGFWLNLVPSLDMPAAIKVFLWPLMFAIEIISFVVKHMVLAIRLFANMLAGHIILAVVLGFILTATGAAFYAIAPMSVLASVPLMTLELFVAGLQAYVFCLLSSLFIGSAIDPHH